MLTQQRVKDLFIVRDDKLHWRDTGILAGYLTTACANGRKIRAYPWVLIDNIPYVVHRLMRLHEDGELPKKKSPDYFEVHHINSIRTDSNRWNLMVLSKSEHNKVTVKGGKKLAYKSADLDPSDEWVRGVLTKTSERLNGSNLYHLVCSLFIMRDSRLYWRSTGVEVGHLQINAAGYPYAAFKYEKMTVHRLIWLYVKGRLPDFRKKPHYVIDHINAIRHDCNYWNLQEISAKDNIAKSEAWKAVMEKQRLNKEGFWNKEISKMGIEACRKAGIGFFSEEWQARNQELLHLKNAGFYNNEIRKMGLETQRANGQGWFDKKVHRKAINKSIETHQRNGTGFADPEFASKASAKGKEVQRRRKTGFFNPDIRKLGVAKASHPEVRSRAGRAISAACKARNNKALELALANGDEKELKRLAKNARLRRWRQAKKDKKQVA